MEELKLAKLEELKKVMDEKSIPFVPYVFKPEDLPRLIEEADKELRRWLDEGINRR